MTEAPAAPSASPAPSHEGGARGPGICDDFLDQTFSIGGGRQPRDCKWLRSLDQFVISRLCTDVASGVYDICEETCGKCKETCEDDANVVFLVFIADDVDPEIRGCAWLNDRPRIRNSVCVPDHDAYEVCPETCNTCAGENAVRMDVPDYVTAALEERDRIANDNGGVDGDSNDFLVNKIRNEGKEEDDDEIRKVGTRQ